MTSEEAKAELQRRIQAGQAKAIDPATLKSIPPSGGPDGGCYIVNIFTGQGECYDEDEDTCNAVGGVWFARGCS
jgi:hypothetical protein